MKNRLTTLLGFALATVSVITYLHVQKSITIPDAFDGLISAFYFSIIFGVGLFGGVWIFSIRSTPARSLLLAGMAGFNAGLMSWLFIYLFWLAPWTAVLRHHALVFNSILIFCAGVVMNKVPIYTFFHEHQKE